MSEKKNPYSVPTTGHVWDETLGELLNEPPKWWWIGFHASWIFVLVYCLIYPAIPLVNSHTKGLTGWTSIKEFKEDMQAIESVRAKYEDKLPGMSVAAILADDELSEYAVRSAKVLFGDNCAACHGAGGSGNPGFPVLADDDWLYGGAIETIEQSITLASAIAAGKVLEEPLYMEKGCVGCHTPAGTGMAWMAFHALRRVRKKALPIPLSMALTILLIRQHAELRCLNLAAANYRIPISGSWRSMCINI